MTLLVLFKFSYLWFSAFYWVLLIVLYFSVLVTIDEISVLLALLFGLYNLMVILLNASYIAIVAMSMLFLFLGFHGLHGMEFKWWFEGNYLSMMLCMCLNECHSLSSLLEYIVGKLMGFDGTLFYMHDEVVCISLAIYKFSCVPCWECFALLRTLVELNIVWGFSVPRNPVKTLSPVWNSGKGSSSPVWRSGRGLVRVLYPLACVKQWGGESCFSLFRLVASIVPDVRCIDVFTHNSLRDKGDNMAALSGTHRTICSRKLDVVVGWEVAENQRLIIITICEELRWMWCYAWFSRIYGILFKCHLNAMLSIIAHVLFGNFFYISLFMVSLPLFVCLCVCFLFNDRITCVLYGSRW